MGTFCSVTGLSIEEEENFSFCLSFYSYLK